MRSCTDNFGGPEFQETQPWDPRFRALALIGNLAKETLIPVNPDGGASGGPDNLDRVPLPERKKPHCCYYCYYYWYHCFLLSLHVPFKIPNPGGRKSNWPVGSWALLGLGRVRDFFSHPRQHSAGEVISPEKMKILTIKGGMEPPPCMTPK